MNLRERHGQSRRQRWAGLEFALLGLALLLASGRAWGLGTTPLSYKGGTNLSTPSSWNGTNVATGLGSNYTGTFTAANVTSPLTLNTGTGITLAELIFQVTNPADTITINQGNGSANGITLGNSTTLIDMAAEQANVFINAPITIAVNGTINILSATTLFLGGSISGTNRGFTKIGGGTLLLSGINSFTGGLSLANGTLDVNSASALGTGTVTLGNNMLPSVALDNTSGAAVAISTNNSIALNGTVNFAGTSDLNLGNGTVTLKGTQNINMGSGLGNLTLGGTITGNTAGVALTEGGSSSGGSLILNGNNTFSGNFNLSGGQVDIGNSHAFGTGIFNINGTARIDNVTGANLTLSANNSQIWGGAFTFIGSNYLNLGTGAVTLQNAELVTVNANSLEEDGNISGTGASLTKGGAGILILGGNNTYDSGTTVAAGTLIFNSPAAIAPAPGVPTSQPITVDTGGTVATAYSMTNSFLNNLQDFSNGNENSFTIALIGNNSNNLNFNSTAIGGNFVGASLGALGNATYSGVLTPNAMGGYILGGGNGTLTMGASNQTNVLTGTNALTVVGPGNVVLDTPNNLSGTVTLSGGALLAINNPGALGTGTLVINGGNLDNTSGAPISLTTSNPQTWNANYTFIGTNNLDLGNGPVSMTLNNETITVNAGNLEVDGGITGTGLTLVKAGNGTLILAGTNSYGTTNITTGVLQFNNAASIPGPGQTVLVAAGASVAAGYPINQAFLSTLVTSASAFTVALGANSSNNLDFSVNGANLSNATLGSTGNFAYSGVLTPFGTTYNLGGGGGVLQLAGTNGLTGNTNGVNIVGPGTVALAAANNYGGGTTVSSGTLAIDNVNSLGTGALTLAGGNLDNTSGSLLTLGAVPLTWSGSFGFIGTNDLNLGTGNVTLTTNPTVTVDAGNLTVGGIINGVSFGLGLAGNGTLILTANETYNGTTTVSGGTLDLVGVIGSSPIVQTNGTINANNTLNSPNITISGGNFLTNANGILPSFTNVTVSGNGTLNLGTHLETMGNVTLSGGNITGSGVSLNVTNLFTVQSGNLSLPVTGTGGLAKTGNTAITLNLPETYTGSTTVNAGTLTLDFSGPSAPSTNIITSTSPLILAGGALNLNGNPSANNAQTFGGTTINAGYSTLMLTLNGATSLAYNLGTLTRNPGGYLDVATTPVAGQLMYNTSSGTAGTILTSNGTPIGTLGTSDWLAKDATNTNITGLSSVSGYTPTTSTSLGTNDNADVSSGNTVTTLSANTSITSLRFNVNQNTQINVGSNTLTAGGILVTPVVTNNSTITGGSLVAPAAGGDILIVQNSPQTLTIASNIVDNSSSGLTVAGNGNVSLSGNNTFTGSTYIDSGTVVLTNALALQNSTASLQGGTLSFGAATTSTLGGLAGISNLALTNAGTPSLPVTLTAGGNNFNTTYSGVLSGAGNFTKAGSGTLTLSGNNTFTGLLAVDGGTLSVGSDSNLGAVPATVVTNAITLAGGELLATSNLTISSNRGILLGALNSTTGTGNINVGAGFTLTYGGVMANNGANGTTGLIKNGNGILQITGLSAYSGNTTINAGTIALGATGDYNATLGTGNITMFNGTTISSFTNAGIGNNITIAEGINIPTGSNATINMGNYMLLSGVISGGGNLTLNVQTTVTRNAVATGNTLTGTMFLVGSGTFYFGNAIDSFTGSPGILAIDGPINANFATTSTGGVFPFGVLTGNNSSATIGGVSAGAATISVDAGTVNSTFPGGVVANANLIMAGSGNLTLTGNNTSTGNVTINGGSGGGNVIIAGNGTLTKGGAVLGGNTNIFFEGSGPQEVSQGVITGSGNIIQQGSNDLVMFSNVSTYNGSTTLNSGTLTVYALALGGVASSIGNSTNAASNLVLNGGTLQYNGTAAATTDRQFTLGPNGGTLDASGDSATNANLTFSNTNPIVFSTVGPTTFTLAGNNTGNNVLKTAIVDSGVGNSTSLVKNGTGQWNLAGNETYTGPTTVNAGTLEVATNLSTTTIAADGGNVLNTANITTLVTVNSGGTVSGTGNYAGGIVVNSNGTVSPGIGTATGNFTTSSLTLGANSSLDYILGTTPADLVIVQNTLTVNGGVFNIFDSTLNPYTAVGNFDVLQFGSFAGSVANFSVGNLQAGLGANFILSGDDVVLEIVASQVIGTWNSTIGGNWSNSNNWTSNVTAGGVGQTVTFGSAITSPSTVTVDGNFTAGSINFSNPNSYTLAAGTNTRLTLDNGAGNTSNITVISGTHAINEPLVLSGNGGNGLVLNVHSVSNSLTLGGNISDLSPASVTDNGNGTVNLFGVNTYRGGTFLNVGTVAINSANSLGTGNVTFNGGSLLWNGTSADISGLGLIFNSGGATLNTNGNNPIFANSIGGNGTGSLTKTGNGVLALAATNYYSGGTFVNGGEIQFTNLSTFGSGNIVLNGGGLQWASGSNIDISPGPLYFGGNGAIFDTNGNNVTLSRIIGYAVGGANATSGLTKTGNGMLTLSGNNAYLGTTSILQGTLAISSDLNLGPAPSVPVANQLIMNNGTLLPTANITSAANRGLALGPASGSGNGTIVIGNNTVVNWQGSISNNGVGTGGLVVVAAPGATVGSLTLSDFNNENNTFSGPLTIENTTVIMGGSASLTQQAGVGNIIIENGTLQFNGYAPGGTTGGYSSISNPIIVPTGYNATVLPVARGSMPSSVSGGGNILWQSVYVRSDIMGDWSGFTGNLDLAFPGGGGGDVRLQAASDGVIGFPNATVNLDNTVGYMYLVGTSGTVPIGMLIGDGTVDTTDQSNAQVTWTIGAIDTDPTQVNEFDGTFRYNGASVVGGGSVSNTTSNIIWQGAGTWVLNGLEGQNGYTSISSGTLQIGTGQTTGTWTATGPVYDNGNFIIDHSDKVPLTNTISGTGSLTANGTGIVTLGGNNSYTGPTAIQNGLVQITTVANGGLAVTSNIVGQFIVPGITVTNATTTLTVPLANLTQYFLGETVSGTGIRSGVTISSIASNASAVTLTLSNTTTSSVISNLTFGGNEVVDVGSSVSGFFVGETISGNGVPASTTITAIDPVNDTLTLSQPPSALGNITSNTSIFVANSLGGSSNAAVNLLIDGGTLQYLGTGNSTDRQFTMGAGGATLDSSGTGALNFTNSAPIAFNVTNSPSTLTLTGNNAGSNTLGAVISDDGVSGQTSLTKSGSGKWVLTANNTYSGPTTISGGTLVTGSLSGTQSVSIATGAKLISNGTIAGGVTVNGTMTSVGTVGGTLEVGPGALFSSGNGSVGNLTVGSLVLDSGATLNFIFGNQTHYDQIFMGGGGTLTYTGPIGVNLLDLNSNPYAIPGTYQIIEFGTDETGGPAGNFSVLNGTGSGSNFTFVDSGNFLDLVITGGNVLYSWNNTGGGSWGNATNWIGGVPPANATVSLLSAAEGNSVVTLDGNRTVANMTFFNGYSYDIEQGTGGNLTFSNGSNPSIVKLTVGTQYIGAPVIITPGSGLTANVSGAGSLIINGTISESAVHSSITKIGNGPLTLSGNNSYTGNTTINDGIVSVGILNNGNVDSGIGASSNATTSLVLNGGTLQYTGGDTSTDRLFTLGTNGSIDASGTGNLTFSNAGNIAFANPNVPSTLILTGNSSAGQNVFNPTIPDNGNGQTSLTKNGTNTWVLAGNNTYSGVTTINSGTLTATVLGNGRSSQQAAVYGASNNVEAETFGTTTIEILDANGTTNLFPGQTITGSGIPSGTTIVSVDTNTNITISNAANTTASSPYDFSAVPTISGSVGTLVVGENVTGLGIPANTTIVALDPVNSIITLSQNPTTTGLTNPTLSFSSINSLGTSTSDASNLIIGGTLQYTGNGTSSDRSFTFGSGGATLDASGTGPLVLTNNSTPIAFADSNSHTLTLTGNNTGINTFTLTLQDNGSSPTSLTKNGNGTWLVAGNNNGYTGTTTINGGLLQSGGPNALGVQGTPSPVVINNGTLEITTGYTSGASYTFNGGGNNTTSTIQVDSNQLFSLTGPLGGNGTMVISGNGTTALDQASANSIGGITLEGGTLEVQTLFDTTGGGNLTLENGTTFNFAPGTGGSGFGNPIIVVGNATFIANSTTATTGNTLSGSISGNGTLNWVLSGLTTYSTSGNTALANFTGTLNINTAGGGLRINASDMQEGNNATINLAANTNVYTRDGGTEDFGYVTGPNTSTLSGASAQTNPTTYNIGNSSVATDEFDGQISNGGSGGLGAATTAVNYAGDGTLILTAANTYAGNTTVTSGTLDLSNPLSSTIGLSSVINVNGGDLNIAVGNQDVGNLVLSNGTITSSAGEYIANATTTYSVFNGTVDAVLAGGASLVKHGSTGTVYLETANTYTGNTSINAGTLNFDNLNNLGTSNQLIFNGGSLQYAPSFNTDISTMVITMNAAGGTIDTNGNNVTLNNPIGNGGPGALTKAGAGFLVLAANNTFTGGAVVNAGTLQVGTGGAAGSIGAGNVTTNATLILDTSSNTTLAAMNGSGNYLQNGTAAITFNGSNSYTGVTTINGGTLALNSLANGSVNLSANTVGPFAISSNLSGNYVLTSNASANTTVLTIPSGNTSGFFVGQTVAGNANITANTTIIGFSINAGIATVTISQPTIGLISGNVTYGTSPTLLVGIGNTTGMFVGETVTGTNITANSTIVSIDSVNGTVTLNNPVVGPGAGVSATYGGNPIINVGVGNTSGFTVGEAIAGAGIPLNSSITAIDGVNGTVTSSQVAYTTGTTSAYVFNSNSLGGSTNAASNLVINGGTLQSLSANSTTTDRLFTIGANNATLDSSGAGVVTFTNPGALAYGAISGTPASLTLTGCNTGFNTLAASIADNGVGGTVSLAKKGSGTWVLSGQDTFSGNTTVTAGTLLINGNVTNSTVVVGPGTVGGNGSAKNLLLNVNGQLAPGVNGTGTLTVGNFTWNGNGALSLLYSLSSGNSTALLNILGSFTNGNGAGAGMFAVNFQETGYFGGAESYTLAEFGSNVGFTVNDFGAANLPPGLQGNFVLNANSLVFDTSPIPEPAEWGLGAGLLALLAAWRRRRATKPLAGPPVSSSADPDCS